MNSHRPVPATGFRPSDANNTPETNSSRHESMSGQALTRTKKCRAVLV
jgi:hypothetical protein